MMFISMISSHFYELQVNLMSKHPKGAQIEVTSLNVIREESDIHLTPGRSQ